MIKNSHQPKYKAPLPHGGGAGGEASRQIAILGSTGSIGTQALQVIAAHPDRFEARVLTANNRWELLVEQARQFKPAAVVIANEAHYPAVRDALADLPIAVYAGAEALCQVVEGTEVDMVLTAMVGFAGLPPTIAAIKAGKPIALANKETMVVAGELINGLCRQYQVPILPVDSEHSAIFQSIMGEVSPIEKIILTASGGPFRTFTREQLETVTPAMALKHPNWDMGAKVTIDSATMMNKGFEVIEAKWLFDLEPDQINVVVHPDSIIHSMVEFVDGAVIAQLGCPDMREPIGFALSFPRRLTVGNKKIDFATLGSLSFEAPDLQRFPCLGLAFEALRRGGNAPCALNAANEVAVAAYLKDLISFYDIAKIAEKALTGLNFVANPTLDDIFATNREVAAIADGYIH